MAKGKANEKIDAAAVEETGAPEQSQAGGEAGAGEGSEAALENLAVGSHQTGAPEQIGQAQEFPEGNSSDGTSVENAQPEEGGLVNDAASLNDQAQPEPEFSLEKLTRIEQAQIGVFQWVLDECAKVFTDLEIDVDPDLLPHAHDDFTPNVPRAQRILALNQLVERIGHVNATPAVLAQQLKLEGAFKPEHELQQKAAEAALSAFIEMRRVVTDFADRARFWKEAHVAALAPPPAPLPLEDTALELVDAPGASF